MTPAEITAAAERIVARTCAAQGVPPTVEDPAVLARVAALLRGSAPPKRGTATTDLPNATSRKVYADGTP